MAKTKERIAPDLKGFEVAIETLQPDPRTRAGARKRTSPRSGRASRPSGQQRAILVYRFKRNAPPTVISGNGGFLAASRSDGPQSRRPASSGSVKKARAYTIADNRTAETSEWDAAVLPPGSPRRERSRCSTSSMDNPISTTAPKAERDLSGQRPCRDPRSSDVESATSGTRGSGVACGDSISAGLSRRSWDNRASMLWTDRHWTSPCRSSTPGGSTARSRNNNLGDAFQTVPFGPRSGGEVRAVRRRSDVSGDERAGVAGGGPRPQGIGMALVEHDRLGEGSHGALAEGPTRSTRPIWYGWLDGARTSSRSRTRKQSDVWNFDRPSRSDEHPTIEADRAGLAQHLEHLPSRGPSCSTRSWSSGTTVMACERSGRRCFGIETRPGVRRRRDRPVGAWNREEG